MPKLTFASSAPFGKVTALVRMRIFSSPFTAFSGTAQDIKLGTLKLGTQATWSHSFTFVKRQPSVYCLRDKVK
jgi:hypothetical protein